MKRGIGALLVAIATGLSSIAAYADNVWPSRPVTMVVPFAPGIAPDIVARMIAQELGEKLGKNVVVENRSGASGNIGAMGVARAKPDGYTLLLSTPNPVGFNKLMGADIKFDPQTDFLPIVIVGKSPQLIVASPGSGIKTLKDLVDLAKANPETVTVGTPGAGTTSHIAIAALFSENKASMIMVPYRGSPPVADLIGGQVQIGVGLVPSYVGAVNTGQVTGLAVTGRQRSQQLPTVPTAEEAGFPGFEATAWYVLAAPAGTPHEIVQKINTVVNEYLKSEKCRSQFSPMDIQPVGGTPAEAKAFIESEMEKWGPIIRQTNIKM